MSPEEFIEQVWNVERILLHLQKPKKNLQVLPYRYKKRLSGSKRRDDLLLSRIQPCLGKTLAVIVDADGNEISKNYTLQQIRTWYDGEKLDQVFENSALERLKQQLIDEIAKLQEKDSAKAKQILNERRKASSFRSEIKSYADLYKYAKNLGSKYEHLLKISLQGVVPEDKITEVIKKVDTFLLLHKIRECIEVIDRHS